MRNRIAALAMMSLLPLAAALVPSPAHAIGAFKPISDRVKEVPIHCSIAGGHCREREVFKLLDTQDGKIYAYWRHRDYVHFGAPDGYGAWGKWHLHRVY